MSTSPSRQPKGIPVGGQYATAGRAESGLVLEDAGQMPDPDMFDIEVHATYTVNEIPPRCRTPRLVEHKADFIGAVLSVEDEDAPVVIELRGHGTDDLRSRRYFSGAFYEPYLPSSGQTEPTIAGEQGFRAERHVRLGTLTAANEAAMLVQQDLNEYVIVDGAVWRRCAEPRYVVQTFGFGGNHGGTDLSVTYYDNSNIAPDAYFRVDQFDEARTHAIEVAAERGDTESVTRIEQMEPLATIHDPSTLRLVVPAHEPAETRQSRAIYQAAFEEYREATGTAGHHSEAADPEAEQRAWDALAAARAALAARTSDISGQAIVQRPYEEGRSEPRLRMVEH